MTDVNLLWTALIAAIPTAIGSVGLWNYLAARKKAPIDKAQAINAMSAESQGMALDLAKQLRLELDQMREQYAKDRADDRAEFRTALRQVANTWTEWYQTVITDQWDEVRGSRFPPDPPTTVIGIPEDWR